MAINLNIELTLRRNSSGSVKKTIFFSNTFSFYRDENEIKKKKLFV